MYHVHTSPANGNRLVAATSEPEIAIVVCTHLGEGATIQAEKRLEADNGHHVRCWLTLWICPPGALSHEYDSPAPDPTEMARCVEKLAVQNGCDVPRRSKP